MLKIQRKLEISNSDALQNYITDDLLTMTRQPIYNIFACIIISLKPKLLHYVFFRHLVINEYKYYDKDTLSFFTVSFIVFETNCSVY